MTTLTDLRRTARALRNAPGFAAITIITLALGIGANTAIFSVLNSVVLQPLPYSDPGELVRIYNSRENFPEEKNFLSGPDVVELREQVSAFAGLGAMYTYRETGKDLMTPTGPARIRTLSVNSDYFSVYGATPLVGRTFDRTEERGIARVILSHSLWQSYSAGDPGVIGETIDLDGSHYEIVGVMRAGFLDVVGGDVDAWIPQNLSPENRWNEIGNHYLTAVARLKSGVTIEEAQAEVNVFQETRARDISDHYEVENVRLEPLLDDVVGEANTTLFLLLGAAGMVLLIACVNLANLFMSRGIARSKEMSVRLALGSSRGRLFTQVLGESMLLSILGGAAGLAISYFGVDWLLTLAPASLPRAEEISFEPLLTLFALGISLATAVFFGLVPSLRATRSDPNDAMRDGSRGNTGGPGGRALRSVLVASQVAFAMLLLVGAGLLMRSFVRLQQQELGIDDSNIMTFEVHLPFANYPEGASRVDFYQRLHERLRSLPGVEDAAAVSKLPASGDYNDWGFGYLTPDGELDWFGAQVRVVEGDYFDAFRIPLLRGRLFESTDVEDGEWVAVINEAAAERAYGGREVIDQTVRTGSGTFRIVGVVANVAHNHHGDMDEKIYLAHSQYGSNRNWSLSQVVRAAGDQPGLLDAIRTEVSGLDPRLVVYNPESMDSVLGRQISRDRFAFVLKMIIAAVALALCSVGIYGVLSYSVTQRSQEIGIRVALGAAAADVRRLVVRQVGVLTLTGLGVGLAAALASGRFLESMLFGVSVSDPLVYGGVLLVLALVALGSAWLPARRATTINPIDAIRAE